MLGIFHGQKSLEGNIPWGHKESDMPEHPHHTIPWNGSLNFIKINPDVTSSKRLFLIRLAFLVFNSEEQFSIKGLKL